MREGITVDKSPRINDNIACSLRLRLLVIRLSNIFFNFISLQLYADDIKEFNSTVRP